MNTGDNNQYSVHIVHQPFLEYNDIAYIARLDELLGLGISDGGFYFYYVYERNDHFNLAGEPCLYRNSVCIVSPVMPSSLSDSMLLESQWLPTLFFYILR